MGHAVSSSHVLSAAPCFSGEVSSPSSPAPARGPSHKRQSSTNCSNATSFHIGCSSSQTSPLWALSTCLFHGVQSFRNRLLQVRVPHRVTSPARKLALVWAALSTGPQVLPGACFSKGSPRGHTFLQASTCSGMGSLPQATGRYLLHRGPPWTAEEQPASPWSSSQAAGKHLLWCLEYLLPLLLH